MVVLVYSYFTFPKPYLGGIVSKYIEIGQDKFRRFDFNSKGDFHQETCIQGPKLWITLFLYHVIIYQSIITLPSL